MSHPSKSFLANRPIILTPCYSIAINFTFLVLTCEKKLLLEIYI